jgi:hypothetical protein
MGPLQLNCLSSNVIILHGAVNLRERINFPHTTFDGTNTEITFLETWVRKPLGHGCFSMFFLGFCVVLCACIRCIGPIHQPTSLPARLSFCVLKWIHHWSIISDQITKDMSGDMINLCEKYGLG